jgi:hypothetical protein
MSIEVEDEDVVAEVCNAGDTAGLGGGEKLHTSITVLFCL